MEIEIDTLDLIIQLANSATFIKSIPEEVQWSVRKSYEDTISSIKLHGSEHKISLEDQRQLAEQLVEVRHFSSAAAIFDRTCLGYRRCYGTQHVKVAIALDRQGFALSSERKFEQAQLCFQKSLALFEILYDFHLSLNEEKEKGSIPTIAINVIDGLGFAASELKRFAESEFYYAYLLDYWIGINNAEVTVGEPHPIFNKQNPDGLKSVNKFGRALQAQGKYREAEKLCMESLNDCIETLGANHPTTQTSVVTLAQLKESQGKIVEAEEMYRRALRCNEEVLGMNHAETLSNVVLIATLRAQLQDYGSAEILYRRALDGYTELHGPSHSDTVDCVHAIGNALLMQSRPTQAIVMSMRAYEERSGYYGLQHPKTLSTLLCLGKAHHLESLWKHRPDSAALIEKAIRVLTNTLAGFDLSSGPDSREAIECADYLGTVLLQCNRFEQSEPYCRRVYDFYHGGRSGKTGNTASQRGGTGFTTKSLTVSASLNLVRTGGGGGGRGGGMFSAPSSPTSRNPLSPTSRAKLSQAANAPQANKYGPMHMKTAEAAYRLASVLENLVVVTVSSSSSTFQPSETVNHGFSPPATPYRGGGDGGGFRGDFSGGKPSSTGVFGRSTLGRSGLNALGGSTSPYKYQSTYSHSMQPMTPQTRGLGGTPGKLIITNNFNGLASTLSTMDSQFAAPFVSTEDERHLEASNLYLQAHEAYRLQIEKIKLKEKKEQARTQRAEVERSRGRSARSRPGTGSASIVEIEGERILSSQSGRETAATEAPPHTPTTPGGSGRPRSRGKFAQELADEEEPEIVDFSASVYQIYELEEMMADAYEQYQHALRRSKY